MESKQPASLEESRSGDTNQTNKSEERHSAVLGESNVEVSKPANPDVSSGMVDDFLRLIRVLIEEKPKPSKLQVILNSALASVVAGSLLTGGIGTYLTYRYGKQQQELAARRSFSDELNKTRIQKFGEVWERIDENELVIENLLDDSLIESRKPNKDSSANNERADKIRRLIQEDLAIISKNRFWLGEQNYKKTREYLDINIKYALNKLLVLSPDLTEIIKQREQAKHDILEIRSLFLAGEL